MARFVEGRDRDQATLFPQRLDESIGGDNPVRVVDAFIDALDLAALGFDVEPEATGRPRYHPATLLKLYLYGYLNQVQSSRRLERECQRNIDVMWLIGQFVPDFKTIADFRRDNGPAIRKVCARFVALCRNLHLLDRNAVAIDGSKFKISQRIGWRNGSPKSRRRSTATLRTWSEPTANGRSPAFQCRPPKLRG